MEELLALLAGAGAIALSPLLIPGVRPIAKSAVKGGMAVADAAKGAAAATGNQIQQIVSRAGKQQAAAETAAVEPASTQTEAGATAELPPVAPAGAPKESRPVVDLRPVVKAAVKGGQSLAGAAAGAVAGAAAGVSKQAAGVSKQWNDLVAEASAELHAEQAGKAKQIQIAGPADSPGPVAAEPAVGEPMVAASAVVEPVEMTAPAEEVAPAVAEPAATQAPIAAPLVTAPLAEAVPMAEPVQITAPPEEADTTAEPLQAPDDLRRIRGIGPKVAELLQAAGITTFVGLAETDPDQLRGIVAQGGSRYRLIDPTPWPDEARRLAGQD